MSNHYYNDLWRDAQSILDETTYLDNIQISSKPSRDRNHLHKQISIIFANYMRAINKLGECYDQVVHPQKRQLMRKVLDCTVIRYLELKLELVNLSFCEFTYLDEAMEKLRLVPHDLELNIPECYKRERIANIQWKYKFISDTLTKLGMQEEQEPGIQMSEEESILLIQRHERARQCRVRAQFIKNIREIKDRTKSKQIKNLSDAECQSALKIQKVWRGFITRRKIQARIIEEMLLIGMLQPDSYATDERDRAKKMKLSRYKTQEKYELQYQVALQYEKEEIKRHRGNIIMEEIRDEIRNWYFMQKRQTGKFPTIPSEDHGGFRMVIGRQSSIMRSSEGSRSVAGISTDSKALSKTSNVSQEEKKKRHGDGVCSGFKLAPSNVLSELDAANNEYKEVWKDLDETQNPEQRYDLKFIKIQKAMEVEEELQKIVDAQMKVELETLQAALKRDEKGKRIKKVSKKKIRHSSKKSKKKKEKDLTTDRTTESLFEELIENGIIRQYPQTLLASFRGEMSYVDNNFQNASKQFSPALGDVRQVIKEFCILPMSSVNIHQTAPLIRSVLLAGPRSCGKNMLVNAICTELGAVLFDLSAANIAGKYPGKVGLTMLIHLVNKVSKLLQPSVIFIDNAEKTFLKKVPKTDKTDPRRLRKDLLKIVKFIGPTDLVMVIGVTHAPWDCDQKSLIQTYNKILLILRPDYASINMLWSDLLRMYNADSRDINLLVCTLTKLSDGYTVGTITKAMQRLMTCKRSLRLKIQPLDITEILVVLSQYEPVYKEEEEAFVQWYLKTPVGRSLIKNAEPEGEEQAENEADVKSERKKKNYDSIQ